MNRFTSQINHLAHSIRKAKGYSWSRCVKQAFQTIKVEATKMLKQVAFFLGTNVTASKLSMITGMGVEDCQMEIDHRQATKCEIYTGSVYVPADFTS